MIDFILNVIIKCKWIINNSEIDEKEGRMLPVCRGELTIPSIGLIRAPWKSIPASALCMAGDEDEFSYMSYIYLTFLHVEVGNLSNLQ